MEKIYKLINLLIGIVIGKIIVNFLNSAHFLIFNAPINKDEIIINDNGHKYKLIIN